MFQFPLFIGIGWVSFNDKKKFFVGVEESVKFRFTGECHVDEFKYQMYMSLDSLKET